MSFTIHPVYQEESRPAPFKGTRDELVPGAYLGHSARPDLMKRGDVIVGLRDDDGETDGYYFDPELLIDGNHFIRVDSWTAINA